MGVYANFESDEGIVVGTKTVTLARKSRKLIITNDSTKDLQYKFNSSESYGTLKPTETLSLDFISKTIYLSGNTVAYRIWSYG